MEQTMNRRTFVQTAGAAAAVAGLACMARVGKAGEATEMAWDYEADLVAVGGGGAGLCAGNWMPAFYPGCGWAILGTMVWGRKAGQNVAAEEPWE